MVSNGLQKRFDSVKEATHDFYSVDKNHSIDVCITYEKCILTKMNLFYSLIVLLNAYYSIRRKKKLNSSRESFV